jgi:hypothetical protein
VRSSSPGSSDLFVARSFTDRLVDRYGSHVEATDANLPRFLTGRLGFSTLDVFGPRVALIVENSDVSRGSSGGHSARGRLGQLFELTPLAASSEGATLRRR